MSSSINRGSRTRSDGRVIAPLPSHVPAGPTTLPLPPPPPQDDHPSLRHPPWLAPTWSRPLIPARVDQYLSEEVRILLGLADEGFLVDFSRLTLVLYTDGSSKAKNNQLQAGYGVYFGRQGLAYDLSGMGRVKGVDQSSSAGEIFAIIVAIRQHPAPMTGVSLQVRTDYLIAEDVYREWRRYGSIANFVQTWNRPYDLPTDLDIIHQLWEALTAAPFPVFITWLPRATEDGNEFADVYAVEGAALPYGATVGLDPPPTHFLPPFFPAHREPVNPRYRRYRI